MFEESQIEQPIQMMPFKTWNERQVQDAVYIHCALKNHEIIVPNSCVFSWESDVISVNKTGFISEFEIKVSRADFKADAKKERATLLVNPEREDWFGRQIIKARPNYFFYAVPEGLIAAEEVPDYAGLIYVHRHVEGHRLSWRTASEIKPAKRLHREKISEWQRRQLCRAMSGRYWRQRLRLLESSLARDTGIAE
jgi:Ni/Co efflux regulator RcnB